MLADWAPPLLVLGLTPRDGRGRRAARVGARRDARPASRSTYWLAVWYVVHIPGVYGYALDHRWALGIEHLLFLDRRPRVLVAGAGARPDAPRLAAGLPGGAFFLAAPVALLIALAGSTIYPFYDTTPHLWGLTPLEDQRSAAC